MWTRRRRSDASRAVSDSGRVSPMVIVMAMFGRQFPVSERPYFPTPSTQPTRRRVRRRPDVRVGGIVGRRRRVGRIAVAVTTAAGVAAATADRPESCFTHII